MSTAVGSSRITSRFLAFVATVLFAASASAVAQTNLLVNGGFEQPTVGKKDVTINAGGTALTGWTIGGDSIEVIGDFFKPAEGVQSLDLNGNKAGAIAQTVNTDTARVYRLRFKYSQHPTRSGNPPRVAVQFGLPGAAARLQEEFVFAGKSKKDDMQWVTVERDFFGAGPGGVLSFTSIDGSGNPHGIVIDDVSIVDRTASLTTMLLRLAPKVSGGWYMIGRINGLPPLAGNNPSLPGNPASGVVHLRRTVYCNGFFNNPVSEQDVPVLIYPDGYFLAENVPPAPAANDGSNPNLVLGQAAIAQVTAPVTTSEAPCVTLSYDNDTWPLALDLGSPDANGNLQPVFQHLDAPGKSRWYRFKVLPGQRLDVRLPETAGDYDIAVFKDIGQAFLAQLVPQNSDDLLKLSAEYAPSVFSPSVFSPSVFSPSVFSPEAYAPSVFSPDEFSPSVFSPSVFSPSVFSPSVFSPSVFSPSVFSPSVFSPSVFSPSVFSPSVFSPSVFSPEELAAAFANAQMRSIVAVSATPGESQEQAIVNTWNNTGYFYVRVAGRPGSFSNQVEFSLEVNIGETTCTNVTDTALTPVSQRALAVTQTNLRTLILTDTSDPSLAADKALLVSTLETFRLRPEIGGAVVDVANDPRVIALKQQATQNGACPFAKNLVAQEIKGIVDAYRGRNANLRYIVIAGNDGAIPFFRYPDESMLGMESGYVPPVRSDSQSESSLRRDYVLNQDAYGSRTDVSLRVATFPIPGLAVGRLVETPEQIKGMIDAYAQLAGGAVVPRSSLVTGYDFLADAANAVRDQLQAGTSATPFTLITANGVSPQDPRSWKASDLMTQLVARRHDVLFLAGHFSANSALAADFATSLITTDVDAANVNLQNAIVFSAGCHSGYNIVDGEGIEGVTLKLDWPELFARKKATLIAGTGYQYGDTDFIEYSERLYANFAKQLRTGNGVVAVGEALVKAKIEYLATTTDIRGLHQKALLEATLFGLPMLGVNMPGARLPAPPSGGAVTPTAVTTGPASQLGLRTADRSVTPTLTTQQKSLKNVLGGSDVTALWFSGPNGTVSNPGEPALPLQSLNVTPNDPSVVLRGVGFRGGSYTQQSIVPLTGAATTELRGVHAPFDSSVYFPMRLFTPNYSGALARNGGTNLLLTPVQHIGNGDGTSTARKFSSLNVRLYYSGIPSNPALRSALLSDAPTIASVFGDRVGTGARFAATVVGDPKAAIHEVWVTYTNGTGSWTSIDLARCVQPLPAACEGAENSMLWAASAPSIPPNTRFIVQAASGLGLVTLDDNRGSYYALESTSRNEDVNLSYVSGLPEGAYFGNFLDLVASLRANEGSDPIVGRRVIANLGGTTAFGITDATGHATIRFPVNMVPGTYPLNLVFEGDDQYAPDSDQPGAMAVGKADTRLLDPVVNADGTVSTTLTATLRFEGEFPVRQPLPYETVELRVYGGEGYDSYFGITDYLGRATFRPGTLPSEPFLVVIFAGSATYFDAFAPAAQ